MLKTYLEKSRCPKWLPFAENLGKKCYFLDIMYVKAWKLVTESHWRWNDAGEKHLIFWVPRDGSKGPQISKKCSFSHSISIKCKVVSPKILPTYIIVKTIAETYFEKSRYPKWHSFCKNLAKKMLVFLMYVCFMPESRWLKVIGKKKMQREQISILKYSRYLELTPNGLYLTILRN